MDIIIVPLGVYILGHGMMVSEIDVCMRFQNWLVTFKSLFFVGGAIVYLFRRTSRRLCHFHTWSYKESQECGSLLIIPGFLYSNIRTA